jgi:hypothetical protein
MMKTGGKITPSPILEKLPCPDVLLEGEIGIDLTGGTSDS